jgi:hypothetical protein
MDEYKPGRVVTLKSDPSGQIRFIYSRNGDFVIMQLGFGPWARMVEYKKEDLDLHMCAYCHKDYGIDYGDLPGKRKKIGFLCSRCKQEARRLRV